jgi:hypothetical protein
MLVEALVQRCVSVLERDDVRGRVEKIVRPAAALILEQLYPYVFVTVGLVIVVFATLVYIIVMLNQLKTSVWRAPPGVWSRNLSNS